MNKQKIGSSFFVQSMITTGLSAAYPCLSVHPPHSPPKTPWIRYVKRKSFQVKGLVKGLYMSSDTYFKSMGVEKVAIFSRDQAKFQMELQVNIQIIFFEIKYIFQTHQINNMKC